MKKLLMALLLALPVSLYCQPKVVLVTGSSKGIGRAICEELAQKGDIVYGTMRHADGFKGFYNKSIKVKELDVTKPEQIKNIVSEIISEQGKIDVLVNNAGFLLLGPCEKITLEQAKAQFETNFFGAFSLMQEVLPHMREQKKGHIINISSTSGFDPVSGFDVYAASKYALEGLSGAMVGYLGQFGIHISLIEPGPVKTALTHSMELGERQLENNPYQAFTENLTSWYLERVKSAQEANEVAELISRVMTQERPKLRYQTDLNSVKRAQNHLVDITGSAGLNAKQTFVQELFAAHIDGSN